MKKLNLIFVTIALIISLIINFNKPTFFEFVLSLFITTLLVSGILFFINNLIIGIKQKNNNKIFISILLIFVLSFIFIFIYYLILSAEGICPLMLGPPAHFRTNIITGKCDFFSSSSCPKPISWYYKIDCDISKDEKINIIRKSKLFQTAKDFCNNVCKESELPLKICLSRIGVLRNQEIRCSELLS